jgi:LruC domain-containing protein
VLLGIEDTSRPGGDNDFNDAVFFITANPYRAVVTENMASAKAATGTDTDGDNVLDRNDVYPNDAQRAFNVFSPAENVFGSLAFEDMWPDKGDYDMNDVVVDYNFKAITNVANEVVELQGQFKVRALGASYQNGFAIELPVASDKVASVTYDKARYGSLPMLANGTEAGQEKAVLVLFNNSHDLFGRAGLVNTQNNQGKISPVSLSFSVKFTTPISLTELGYAPFNAFIFVNERAAEVHLPGMPPTTKANLTLLGSKADSSRPQEGRFYKSGDNLPWAINLPLEFNYPVEGQAINKAHLKFAEWAKSGGNISKDWYKNSSGYRQAIYIYQ